MLTNPSIESLLPRAENRYVLAMLTARRARQLTAGARPTVESETPNHVSLAGEEISAGTVVYRYGKWDVVIPEHPRIIAAREAAEREARAKEEEELLEEQSRIVRQADRFSDEDIFVQTGITAEDASLIAERLIAQIEAEERKAAVEEVAAREERTDDAADEGAEAGDEPAAGAEPGEA